MTKRRRPRKSNKVIHPKPRKAKAGTAAAPPVKLKGPKGTWTVRPPRRRLYAPKKTFKKGKGTPPPKVRKLISKARTYRKARRDRASLVSRNANKRLVRALEAQGYTRDYISRAKRKTLTGRVVRAAVQKYYYTDRRFKTVKKRVKGKIRKVKVVSSYRVNGRWMSAPRFRAKVQMTKYNAVLRHYRELYGLTLKEARELYRGLRDQFWGQRVFNALY